MIFTAEKLAGSPMSGISRSCDDLASSKAAYRLFVNARVNEQSILAAHVESTVKRIGALPEAVILSVQDTTYLSYDHHPSTEGLGPISPGGPAIGLLRLDNAL
jgi:hypothetical protein